MLLTCPNCQTEYDVPDAALTGRSRRLRCANCMTSWKAPALEMYRDEALPEAPAPAETATLPETVQPEEVVAIDEPTPMQPDEPMAVEEPVFGPPPAPERVSMLKTSRDVPAAVEPKPAPKRGLAISVLIVVLIVIVVLVAHRPIGDLWPPSLRLFNALGLR